MTMVGKWLHVNFTDEEETFLTGEIVAMHGEHYCEVRPLHIGDDSEAVEARTEPAHTKLISLMDATNVRLFDSEQALRDWWAWLFRPETLTEARRRLRS